MKSLPLAPVIALLVLAVALVYSNSLHNGFHLDDSYGLVDNPMIRDLSNIPEYFKDPRTLTTIRSNADYRPILQITFALNYAISEYRPWSWHLLNLLLHSIVATALFLLGRRLLGTGRLVPLSWLSEAEGDLAAAGAALWFAVHPIGSGCANYMWARSSLLVAAFVLPATVLHLRSLSPGGLPALATAVLLYLLALFTKVEAISFLAIVALVELLALVTPPPEKRPMRARLATAALRFAPYLLVSAGYLAVRAVLVPEYVEVQRHEADMTPYFYLLTQLRVWWLYVARFIAPVELVTDDKSYAVSHSLFDPFVLHALVGWLAVGALLLRAVFRAPVIAFLALAFFVHLSPHSSVAPLAEMHNEHRPYLASTSLFLLAAVGVVLLARAIAGGRRWAAPAGFVAFALSWGAMTYARNRIWVDDESFWSDILLKAPHSTRAQLNYGLILMARGQLAEAEQRFRESIRLAPQYPVAFINLGIARDHQGDLKGALEAMDTAVRLTPNESGPYYWRGYTRARNRDFAGAVDDLQRAVQLDERDLKARSELARTLNALGRTDDARAVLRAGLPFDHVRFQAELDGLVPPPRVLDSERRK